MSSLRAVYRGPVFWVSTDEVLEPGGVRARRDLVHRTGSFPVVLSELGALRGG